jgi:hypothetical protein
LFLFFAIRNDKKSFHVKIRIYLIGKLTKSVFCIFLKRLGRILAGGAKGPGLFFILPCIDSIQNCDLRTITFDVMKNLIEKPRRVKKRKDVF